IPWWAKIGAKIIFSRLNFNYSFWKRIQLFEHGDMNDPHRAYDIFVLHARAAGMLDESLPPYLKFRCGGGAVLELGPGDSLFSGVIAKFLGATHSWMVDAGAFATRDGNAYARLAKYLIDMGYAGSFVDGDFDRMLTDCQITYLTNGAACLSEIPDDSVDFCFSNAVLEHVPKNDFKEMVRQLRRILKPDGVCVHRVDLKDHLGGALNNLRFSETVWESAFFSNSGFYTNRIRFSEMLDMFRWAGFSCITSHVVQWDTLPIRRSLLAQPFRDLPDNELRVSGFDVVLRPMGDQ
ncbi:MAG: class I SAM-dependent methyltransferase, partial [Magnetococcales bacterium]|nr:class I SAM-dependent methyltransferase [Magnetococcales bacterium]